MSADSMRERLRFIDFEIRHLQNSRCRARAVLEFHPGERFIGTSEEIGSPAGELRCAAQACLSAIEQASSADASFELLGVKSVRAFDSTVVIVSLSSQEGTHVSRLVGSYISDSASPRGAALAVLNATNRSLGNIFSRAQREADRTE